MLLVSIGLGVAAAAAAPCVVPVRVDFEQCGSCWAIEGTALGVLTPGAESGVEAMSAVARELSERLDRTVITEVLSERAGVVAFRVEDDERGGEGFLAALAASLAANGNALPRGLLALEPNLVVPAPFAAASSQVPLGRPIPSVSEDDGVGMAESGRAWVAVLDTGVSTKSPVAAMVASVLDCRHCNGLRDGKCTASKLDDDVQAHGTCVAAQVVASLPEAIQPGDERRLMVVRVTEQGVSTAAALVAGIEAAVAAGVTTLVVSHTGLCPSRALRAVLEATHETSLVVVGVPNQGVDLADNPSWPASYGWPMVAAFTGGVGKQAYGRAVVGRAGDSLDQPALDLTGVHAHRCMSSGSSYAAASVAGMAASAPSNSAPDRRLAALFSTGNRVNEQRHPTCTGLSVARADHGQPSIDLSHCRLVEHHTCEGSSWGVAVSGSQ